ncbi:MAG: S41 family peptidase [Bryobacteraceae bacterium]|nr:S41 family peptidase [Bryobacteraceae bacterium]
MVRTLRVAFVISFTLLLDGLHAQVPLNIIRGRGKDMLAAVRKHVEKNYFDPTYGGVDMKAAFEKAERQMADAQSAGHTFGIIAQALTTLNDSHTFFIPPSRASTVRYGWQLAMIGDRCFITSVKPGSDAEQRGMAPGDEVLSMQGFRPDRNILWKMKYMYYVLQPQAGLRFELRTPAGEIRQVEAAASIKQGKLVLDLTGREGDDYYEMLREAQAEGKLREHIYYNIGKELMIYKMPTFSVQTDLIDRVIGKVRDYPNLIIDLRGNGGGAVSTLERLAGYLLPRDAVIAERKGRKEEKPMKAARVAKPYEGKLAILIDSESASASELLARAVQIEGRGKVYGDRSAGSVRQSRQHEEQMGADTVILYSVSVTNADIFMKDGKPLEHVGVQPDELILPTPADMAAHRDPVLSKAAASFGINLSPDDAGKMFPVKWRN